MDMLRKIAVAGTSRPPARRLPRRRRSAPSRTPPNGTGTTSRAPGGRCVTPSRGQRRPRPASPSRTGCCRCSRSTASAGSRALPGGDPPPTTGPRCSRSRTLAAPAHPPGRLGAGPGQAAARRGPAAAVDAAGVPEPHRRRTCGGSSPTAGCCASCATPPPSPGPPTWRSTWRRCSTGSCSTSSSCSTGCCTSPASRSRTVPRRRRAGWRSGAPRPSRPAPASWTSIRDGVEAALVALGTGFRRHPANVGFRDDIDPDLVKRALLRLVYRLLFWFVAEERDALHARRSPTRRSRDRYRRTSPPAGCARRRCAGSGGAHGDLWQAVQLRPGRPRRRERPPAARPARPRRHLRRHGTDQSAATACRCSNEYLLAAVRSLSRFYDKADQAVPPRRLPAPGLRRTRLHLRVPAGAGPEVGRTDRQFLFRETDEAGAERPAATNGKKTGSYYTPTSLIDCLLDSVAGPGPRRRGQARRASRAAACRAPTPRRRSPRSCCRSPSATRPAAPATSSSRRPAGSPSASPSVREHNPEPPMDGLRHALRDVVATCVYGVDLNPMAVELAKVSLWMEALEPGQAAVLPRRPHQAGQRPDRRDPGPDRRRHPGGRVQADRGRRPEVRRVAGAGEQRRAVADRRAAARRPQFSTLGSQPCSRLGPDQDELFSDEIISQSNAAPRGRPGRIAAMPDGDLREVHEQAAAYRELAGLRGVPRNAPGRRRLVRRLRLDQARGRARPRIVNRVFQALSERGRTSLPPATADRDRAPARGVRLLPLAPGVPGHLPRRRGRPAMLTRTRAGRAASPASWPTRRGTRSTSRTRSTSASSSRPSR